MIMSSITEHLIKLQELTQTNLDILKTINDSFFTKQNHLSVNVGDNKYAIPSFISLENKVNALAANFENLVNSPKNGEAFFTFNGDTRAIEVRSYESTPQSLVLTPVKKFNTEQNDIFKDFVTPVPYIQFNLSTLPNDITEVNVKKIIPIHSNLVEIFKEGITDPSTPSKQYNYSDLFKILDIYTQDEDYIEYDTRMTLPIRSNIGHATYVVESIISDEIDENLDNYITFKIRTDLNSPDISNSLRYKLFNETIDRPLKVGDRLTSYDGNTMLEITEIRVNTSTLVVKVLHGEYVNLVPSGNTNYSGLSDLNKLRFFSPIDFDEDKYVKIPLEEDKLIFIAVAPLNSRMNVQSSWGTGLMVNTYELKDDNNIRFEDHYKNNVRNIGDVLFEITSMMSNTLTKYTKAEFDEFTGFVPTINTDNLQVIHINKHLNDTKTIQNIRSLHSQKNNYKNQLETIDTSIKEVNASLSSVSYDDVTGVRDTYMEKLNDLNTQRNNISDVLAKIMNDIATAANDSETPIEAAKYRIRGFYDCSGIEHVKGIRVQYRYKNAEQVQGTAVSISNNFIFSDWNLMSNFDKVRTAEYDSTYKFNTEAGNDNVNEPSFNQIDIPISQGESVDIRLKVVYDYGYPFVEVTSAWSPVVNIKFPNEFLKDVHVLDIISENNSDIETNRFSNIIKKEGIPEHINDKITDQDVIYYHKPENISSGFTTPERRIIPLKDKLMELDSSIIALKDEIIGANSEDLVVSVYHGNTNVEMCPYQKSYIQMESYDSFNNDEDIENKWEGIYTKDGKLITTVLNISLYNNSDHVVKLFSMFPGNRETPIYNLKNFKFIKDDYCSVITEAESGTESTIISGANIGVWFEHPTWTCEHSCDAHDDVSNATTVSVQGGNQFMYFRVRDVNTGEYYYGEQNDITTSSAYKEYIKNTTDTNNADTVSYLYPYLSNRYGLCIDSDTVGDCLQLKPNEEILIPLIFEFRINKDGDANGEVSTKKTISFDILPSLYKDPKTYTLEVSAKGQVTAVDKVVSASKINVSKVSLTRPIKYKPAIWK